MVTLHHLNDSRSQRVLWLLEELGVPYEIVRYQRDAATNLAPPELKAVHPLGKSPVITDRGRTVVEAGATRGPIEQYPNLVSYMDRMQARPAHRRALERGGPYRFAKTG